MALLSVGLAAGVAQGAAAAPPEVKGGEASRLVAQPDTTVAKRTTLGSVETLTYSDGTVFSSRVAGKDDLSALSGGRFDWEAHAKCCAYSREWQTRASGRTSIRLDSFSPGCNYRTGAPEVRFYLEKKGSFRWSRVGNHRDLSCFGETNYWNDISPGTYRFYFVIAYPERDQKTYTLEGHVTYA